MDKVSSRDRTTLMLDYSWSPLGVLTARACFKHFIKGRVIGLDKNNNMLPFNEWYDGGGEYYHDQPCISSSKELWALPTIVIITDKFLRKFNQRTNCNFRELCIYWNYECQICLNKFPPSQLSIEHIKPRSKGGTNTLDNKTITCRRCNCQKSDKFPYVGANGKQLTGTKLTHNHVFVEQHTMRDEWIPFINK